MILPNASSIPVPALAALMPAAANRPCGFIETGVEGVRLYVSDRPTPTMPLVYSSGLTMVLSGAKRGAHAGASFAIDPSQAALFGLPISFECKSEASAEEPLVGLFLDVGLADLQLFRPDHGAARGAGAEGGDGLGLFPVDAALRDAAAALVEALLDPRKGPALGPGRRAELLWLALGREEARVFDGLAESGGHYAKIATLTAAIVARPEARWRVPDMAERCAMGVSSFHRLFRAVTGRAPMVYVKAIRLERARRLLAIEQTPIAGVAAEVGYASASQFAREFADWFRMTPGQARRSGGRDALWAPQFASETASSRAGADADEERATEPHDLPPNHGERA